MALLASIERHGASAQVHLRGDATISTARTLYTELRDVARDREVEKIVLDCSELGRLDSAGVAVLRVAALELATRGQELALERIADEQRAAFALAPADGAERRPPTAAPTWLEQIGLRVLSARASASAAVRLLGEVLREGVAIATRRRRLPAGSVVTHALAMGVDGVFVVGLLAFLLGVTIAFLGVLQLSEFGASVFVADMVGWAMVREFGPFVTAIVLSGRTGAAIAAELGAMRVGQEIDALAAMGVSPARYLVLPRLAALTFALPALTLIAMFLGITGGMFVVTGMLDTTPRAFWLRAATFVDGGDFALGFGKAFVFAWIIGLAGSHLGLRTSGDASGVGRATTRTVVVSIFLIILVDAAFAAAVAAWERW
ncbi:MAG: ABC transporter permease [Kofleriaceae bacterium]|nr:ABC transporter permease [Kofleriaceae bacterium]